MAAYLPKLRPLLRPTTVGERNVRNVIVDGIGVGLVVGVGTFLPVFLVRLGASSFLVGLLTSLPAFTGALLGLPVGRMLERQRNIVPWYSGSRVWVLLSYALFGLLPFIVPQAFVPATIIGIWALVTIPSTIVNVTFPLVMGGVAGPERRFYLMSLRWSTLGLSTAVGVMLIGQILERIAFPLNYQLVFIASFAGGLLSYVFSRSIVLPDNPPPPAHERRISWGRQLREGWQGFLATPAFARFVGSAFVFRSGIAMALPLFPLYWVREVHASDAWIGIISTANSVVLMVAYFTWSVWARRFGNRRALLITSMGMSFYPLLTAVTPVMGLLAFFAGLVGFFSAGNDLVNFDLALSTCPKEHQATYIAFNQTTQNIALFLFPIVGTLLADMVGLRAALVVASGLRLLGVGMYAALGVGGGAPKP